MARIVIDIDVLNPSEVIKNKKGTFLNWFSTVLYSEETRKKKVEQKICSELVKKLRENLDHGLRQEGIAAKIRISAKADP